MTAHSAPGGAALASPGRIVAGPGGAAEPLRFGKSSFVRAAAGVGELYLYDEIGGGIFGGGITAKDVARALEECRGCSEIRVRLSSPGGDFWEGLAIYNLLERCEAKTTCSVDGLAASIASIIALGCDRRVTASTAAWMIHEARCFGASGDADDMEKMAARLKQASATMAETYASHTGRSVDEIKAWMAEEKWFTAAEAKEYGFSHETDGEGDAAAVVLHAAALDHFAKTPQTLRLAAHAALPPLAPITPAPRADPKEPPMLKLIAARLGLPETATEAEVIAALARVQDAESRARTEAKAASDALAPFLALSGKTVAAEALGTFQSLKADAEKVPALTARVAELERAAVDGERNGLIEEGKKDGKLAPALEAWAKEQPIVSLKAFLAAAAPVVTPLKDGKKPGEEGGEVVAVTEDQKKIAAQLGVKPEDVAKRIAAARA